RNDHLVGRPLDQRRRARFDDRCRGLFVALAVRRQQGAARGGPSRGGGVPPRGGGVAWRSRRQVLQRRIAEFGQQPVRRHARVGARRADVIVAVGRDGAGVLAVANDHRSQENEQIGLHAPARVVTEQLPEERYIAESRDL